MTTIRKTLALACAVSVLGLGTAFAQTDPAAPPAPAGGAMSAPAPDAAPADASAMPKKKMMKKHMSKKHMSKKHMKKAM